MRACKITQSGECTSAASDISVNYQIDGFVDPTPKAINLHVHTYSEKGRILSGVKITLEFDEALHLAHRLLSLISETGSHTGKPTKD